MPSQHNLLSCTMVIPLKHFKTSSAVAMRLVLKVLCDDGDRFLKIENEAAWALDMIDVGATMPIIGGR